MISIASSRPFAHIYLFSLQPIEVAVFDASKAKKVESLAIFYSGSAKVIVKTT